MASYSLEKLLDKLDKNSAWRKKELTLLKSNIDRAEGRMLLTSIRSSIALLYAHWEGFIKHGAREYLEYLNAKQLNCKELTDNFLILALKKTIVDSRQSNKSLSHAVVINKILYERDMVFKVDVRDELIINTESNLSYDVLKDILYSLGIKEDRFELKEHYIKDKLLNNRNKIVHGEYTRHIFTNDKSGELKAKKEFNELYKEIVNLKDVFKDKIINAALNESYLKSKNEDVKDLDFE